MGKPLRIVLFDTLNGKIRLATKLWDSILFIHLFVYLFIFFFFLRLSGALSLSDYFMASRTDWNVY